jgi:hypothetical protein
MGACGAVMLAAAVVRAVRCLVAAVFAVAAWGKAADHAGTRQAMMEFGIG